MPVKAKLAYEYIKTPEVEKANKHQLK